MIAFHDELQVEDWRVEVGVLVPSPLKEGLLEAAIAFANEDLCLFREAMPLAVQRPVKRVLSVVP